MNPSFRFENSPSVPVLLLRLLVKLPPLIYGLDLLLNIPERNFHVHPNPCRRNVNGELLARAVLLHHRGVLGLYVLQGVEGLTVRTVVIVKARLEAGEGEKYKERNNG